jgi:RNA polymerase sigma factor (sigma-70 family)
MQYSAPSSVYTCMDTTLTSNTLMTEQDKRIVEAVTRERGRLRNFIRRRVPDAAEVEDILQDVFFEFVEACRLPEPIEQVGAWLFRVARNRIVDRFRKKREEPLPQVPGDGEGGHWLEEVLPSAKSGAEAAYARAELLEEVYAALDELPQEQREVFIAHELEGRSFRELAAESGVALNTLLARKRYAVLHLRARLQATYDEFDL